ncbi:hypothetical protein Bbelb_376950 [Branchiostoma belcheri]|nr:hypothetical protein Bbelb_376950 [Branchiostoma belcheri]
MADRINVISTTTTECRTVGGIEPNKGFPRSPRSRNGGLPSQLSLLSAISRMCYAVTTRVFSRINPSHRNELVGDSVPSLDLTHSNFYGSGDSVERPEATPSLHID